MFLRAFQKAAVICAEGFSLKRASVIQNGVKIIQHMKYTSTAQCPQKIVPDAVAADFVMVEKLMKQNADDGAKDFLFNCFGKEKDSYSYALYMMSQASTSNNNDPGTLAYAIVHAFWHWQKSNSVSQPLTSQLQTEALISVLPFKNRLVVELVCFAFKINSQCDFVCELIENYITEKKYEEAATCITILDMQDKYPAEKLLVPLVLQGNLHLVRMYVGGNKALQLKLVCALDKTLRTLSSQKKMPLKLGKLMVKSLSALLESYEIPLENCPNLCEIRAKSVMNYLIQKRYVDRSVSEASWNDLIRGIIVQYPRLRKKLIFRLVEVKDLATAFQVATKFEIPADEWPSALKTPDGGSKMSNFSSDAEVSQQKQDNPYTQKNDVEYLTLRLDDSCVKYVETAEQFVNCLNDISKNYDVVGVDSEWKPSFGNWRSRLSLLQLAVEDNVYLLDMLALSTCMQTSHWDALMENIFGNPKILKLGCALMCDVEMLVKSHEGTEGMPLKFSRLLDLAILFEKFQCAHLDSLPSYDGNTMGLSKICLYILGKPLLKTESISNWEVRPLTDAQLTYAALDAYCVLQIYSKMQEIAKENNFNFEVMLQDSIALTSEMPKETSGLRRKMKWSKYVEGFQVLKAVSITNFKVLLDSRFEDVGRELKLYGVDVVPLKEGASPYETLEMAKAEGRKILASSLLYEQLVGLGAERICYNVSADILDGTSIVAYIFEKFNVKVQAHSIGCT